MNANCTNIVGGHNCTCKEGFAGDGRSCSGKLTFFQCVKARTDILSSPIYVNVYTASFRLAFREQNGAPYQASSMDFRRYCLFYLVALENCAEIYKYGERKDSVYTIKPDNLPAFDVFCDQTTAGGGWTVFQKRLDGSVDFFLKWSDYKVGFGDLNGEFWLGLDKIHRLTSDNNIMLRVDLEDFEGNTSYAEYNMFSVMNENDKYKLNLGSYSGMKFCVVLPRAV